MKFYMFTYLLIVVTAEEFLVMLYDNSNDYEMQEFIEDPKYTRLLTDCDDDKFNQNVNIPSTLKLKSKNTNPSKLSFGNYAAQARPGYQNYMQNTKSYMDGWLQQYGYNRPSYDKTPLGQLPPPRKKRRQWVIHNPNGYHPVNRLKDNYNNNYGNVQIKDRSPYYNKGYIYNNNYNQYNNIQNNNNNNINYSKNSRNKNNNKNKSKHKYKNNHQHNNNNQNNKKTPGANNKSVNCNNGRCTICINEQCKECITGMGKCEICVGGSCSSVSL